MATEILATGNTVASSTELNLDIDTWSHLFMLKDADIDAAVALEVKDDQGRFQQLLVMRAPYPQNYVFGIPKGTYRFTRRAGGTCGVFYA